MESILKQLRSVFGSFWFKVWKQPEFVETLTQSYGKMYSLLRDKSVDSTRITSIDDMPVEYDRQYSVMYFASVDVGTEYVKIGDFVIGDGTVIGDAENPMLYTVMCPYTDILFIQNDIINPTSILAKDKDFTLRDGKLYFRKNPATYAFKTTVTVIDGEPAALYMPWLIRTSATTDNLRYFYGEFIKTAFKSTDHYRKMLKSLWLLYVEGSTDYNMKKVMARSLDTDIAEADEIVRAVWVENNRNWVATDNHTYSAPVATTCLVAVSDVVAKGELLFSGLQFINSSESISAVDIPAIVMNPRYISVLQRSLLFENSDLPMSWEYVSTDPTVHVLDRGKQYFSSDPELHIVPRADQVLVFTDPDNLATYALMLEADARTRGVVKLPVFALGGDYQDVAHYRQAMARQALLLDVDIYTALNPEGNMTINPFKFLCDNIFHSKLIFIKVDPALIIDQQAFNACIKHLANTRVAGTNILIFYEVEATVLNVDPSTAVDEEPVVCDMAFELADTVPATAADVMRSAQKIF